MADTGRAHRALDDCVSLRQVMAAAALGLGMSLSALLGRFAQEVDLPSSVAQLSVLMEPDVEQKTCRVMHMVRSLAGTAASNPGRVPGPTHIPFGCQVAILGSSEDGSEGSVHP